MYIITIMYQLLAIATIILSKKIYAATKRGQLLNFCREPNPVITILQEISKPCKYFSRKSCTKNEAFLARYEKSCKNLARKICRISFLQNFHQILQENYLTTFSCKFLARFLYLARKASILVQDLQDMCKM